MESLFPLRDKYAGEKASAVIKGHITFDNDF